MGVAGPTPVRSLFLDWSSMAIGGILTQQRVGAKCGGRSDAVEDGVDGEVPRIGAGRPQQEIQRRRADGTLAPRD